MKQHANPRQGFSPLGKILVESGKVSAEQLAEALEYRNANHVRLGQALVELDLLGAEELTVALKQQGRLACLSLRPEIIDPVVARRIDEEYARKNGVLAINQIADVTTIAMNDPVDVYAIDYLAAQLGTKVLAVYADPEAIEECLDYAYRCALTGEDQLTAMIDENLFDTVRIDEQVEVDEGEFSEDDEGTDTPVINLIQAFLMEAYEARASDIHLEPRDEQLVVRFRIDGTLHERISLRKGWARPCIARLKVMSNLDIAQRRLPQDGRAQVEIQGRRVDLRIATSPTLQGECAVIRILDGGRDLGSLGMLGMRPEQLECMRRMIQGSDGFILAVGPTGSGKTTTLYGLLDELNTPDRKIITLEDPVENQVSTISQINTNPKAGLTFAAGLRSILRQDPDIVLVGEVRDEETAHIAVQAAMTGHLVLSTLHTVGSAETITRLQEMGIEHYLLSDTLRGIVAQRLVRKLCDNCKQVTRPGPGVLARLELIDDGSPFYESQGCELCSFTGYKGRLGLYEIMLMTSDVCNALREGQRSRELRTLACEAGMTSLRDEGLWRARNGETSLSEVLSTTARI